MNLGNFLSGIVAKDPTTPPIVREPVPTVDRMAPLQAAISGGHVQSAPTRTANLDPRSVVLSLARKPEAEVEIKKFEPLIEVPPSQPQTQAIAVPEVTLPTPDLTPPTSPVVSEKFANVETLKPENVEVHPEIKIDGMNLSVKNFLSEVYDVMRMGRELDVLIAQREAQIAKGNGRKEEISDIKAQADSIKKSMEVFANLAKGDVASSKKLEAALVAYDTFLDTFATEFQDEESKLRSEANKTILAINTMKGKLSKLMNNPNGIQNPEDFEQIKKRFRKLNAMRAGQNYPERINKVVETLEERNDPTHAPIFKDAMQRNDIISVLQLVFGDKQPTI